MLELITREEHDDRLRRMYRLKRQFRNLTTDEMRQALGVGGHTAPLFISPWAFYAEVDSPTPEGCQFFGERFDDATFCVVATESHAWLVAKAEEIGHYIRDC